MKKTKEKCVDSISEFIRVGLKRDGENIIDEV